MLIYGIGGARRDRTADPLLAKQVLSQLSYGPVCLVYFAPGFVAFFAYVGHVPFSTLPRALESASPAPKYLTQTFC